MCNYCEKITLVPNFKSPKDYEKTIAYIHDYRDVYKKKENRKSR